MIFASGPNSLRIAHLLFDGQTIETKRADEDGSVTFDTVFPNGFMGRLTVVFEDERSGLRLPPGEIEVRV